MSKDILSPIKGVQIIQRDKLRPNDYNPNKVLEENLKLLTQSILTNGWTLPIVVRPDYTIIDGFHRWMVSGREPLFSLLGGMVPVVVVKHDDPDKDIYGTITHNRARGTHLLEPMENIVKRLLDSGKTVTEICKQIGMKPEEVYRLAGMSREDFLKILIKREEYSPAFIAREIEAKAKKEGQT
jgi:ParB-like chromosome segregation protein Spo0J